jgi:exopolyphosphatase / guanosine-5'-triphosphate,3'-diphosphate pyrophosphatase
MTQPSQCTRRFAGIDIGTLTCRLLIADLIPGQPLKELRSERRILRLGEGVDQARRLNSDAIDRVIHCLQEWRNVINDYQVEESSVVATSAVRDARNRQEFLDRVTREAGFEVEVISGEEEARRTLLGIRTGLPAGVTDILALDIGGGSTELILDRPGQKSTIRSIDIGVVRLCERVLCHDPPSSDEVKQAREWVARETKAAVVDMGDYRQTTFVGTAGTVTSLAAMAQKLPTYEPARIHNYVLRLEDIRELEQTLLGRTRAARVGLPGLEKNREEVIAAGAIIFRTIMETLGQQECLVSDLGLREGVLIDLGMRSSSVDNVAIEDLPAYAHNLEKVLNE